MNGRLLIFIVHCKYDNAHLASNGFSELNNEVHFPCLSDQFVIFLPQT